MAQTAASKLRQMLSDPSKVVVAPGVYDGITARLALAAGFECLYMSGACTSTSRLGWEALDMACCRVQSINIEVRMEILEGVERTPWIY